MKDPSSETARLVPLPPAELHILMALATGDKHGYAIMQQVAQETAGQVRMGPGTLYGTIKRLRESRFIVESKGQAKGRGDDERRRYYRLTAPGRKALSAELGRLAAVVRLARSAGLMGNNVLAGEGAL